MPTQKITDVTIKLNTNPVSTLGRVERFWTKKGYPKTKTKAGNITEKIDLSKTTNDKLIATLEKYKWRGAEFGNWATQDERNLFVVAFLKSCEDMTRILGFKQLGMEYKIGVAYGARGKGGKAAAHFEPYTFMINLTKEGGFGSFAHEYGHALDYFFGIYIEPMQGSAALSRGSSTAKDYAADKPGTLRYAVNMLINSIVTTKSGLSESYKRWSDNADSDYWLRRNEIFARWFEQYTQYLLQKKGIKNTFLSKEKYTGVFYLTPADFKRTLPLGKKLIAQIKKRVTS